MINFCVRLCFWHQIHKLTYSRHCASDLQTSHMTICSQGGGAHQKMMKWIKIAHHLCDHHNFSFGWQGISASKAHGYMATAPGGRMLNTHPHPVPSSPVPALWTLQMSVCHPLHCSTRMVLKEHFWSACSAKCSMFSMLAEHGCGRTEPCGCYRGALHWHPPSS